MAIKNWPLAGIKAQHFHGPVSSNDDTTPAVLREVAEWLTANSVMDSQIHDLVIGKGFVNGDDPKHEDEYYIIATVYYEEPMK